MQRYQRCTYLGFQMLLFSVRTISLEMDYCDGMQEYGNPMLP